MAHQFEAPLLWLCQALGSGLARRPTAAIIPRHGPTTCSDEQPVRGEAPLGAAVGRLAQGGRLDEGPTVREGPEPPLHAVLEPSRLGDGAKSIGIRDVDHERPRLPDEEDGRLGRAVRRAGLVGAGLVGAAVLDDDSQGRAGLQTAAADATVEAESPRQEQWTREPQIQPPGF